MNTTDLTAATTAIAALWPAWKPSTGMLALWGELLADISGSEIRMAVLVHATESAFPPTIADLRRIALTERGLDATAQRTSVRALLQLASPAKLSREDALDVTRDEPWREQRRRELAERYAARNGEATKLSLALPDLSSPETPRL